MMIVKIKPTEKGTTVSVPGADQPLDANGQSVPLTTYWRRRIKDGSVVVMPKTTAAKATSKKKDDNS